MAGVIVIVVRTGRGRGGHYTLRFNIKLTSHDRWQPGQHDTPEIARYFSPPELQWIGTYAMGLEASIDTDEAVYLDGVEDTITRFLSDHDRWLQAFINP